MKNLRMILTGAIVMAIVGSSLAFTKSSPNLFACISNQCILAGASSFNPGGAQHLTATDFYTSNTATTNIVCFRPGSTTQGCSFSNHPQQAFLKRGVNKVTL